MKRFFASPIGPRTSKKPSRYSLDEILKFYQKVDKIHRIDGVEARFVDAPDPKDTTGIKRLSGPSIESIYRALHELRKTFGEENIGLHVSSYLLGLFENKLIDANEFIDSFPYVVSHVGHYKRLWDSHIVDDSYPEKLLNEEFKEKVLIEHGFRSDNCFSEASKLAEEYDTGSVLDIGHKLMEFYEINPNNAFVDSVSHYAWGFDGSKARGWNNRYINSLARRIEEIHVHGVKKWVPIGTGYDSKDHYPFNIKTRTTPVQEELISRLIDTAPNKKRYVIEPRILNPRTFVRTVDNFEKYILNRKF